MKPARVPGEETQLLESRLASQKEMKKQELAGLIGLESQKPLARLFNEVIKQRN